jgi:hypothetical protein
MNMWRKSEALIEPKHELFGSCCIFARGRMKKPPEIGAAGVGAGIRRQSRRRNAPTREQAE